jgi:hypothetical protein
MASDTTATTQMIQISTADILASSGRRFPAVTPATGDNPPRQLLAV